MFQRHALAPSLPPMWVLTTDFKNMFDLNFKLYLYQNLICICVIFEIHLSKQTWWCFSGALRPPPPSDVCLNQADSVIQWRYTCSPSSLLSLIWLSAVQKYKTHKYSCMWWREVFCWSFLWTIWQWQSQNCSRLPGILFMNILILGGRLGKLKTQAGLLELSSSPRHCPLDRFIE